MRNQFFTGVYMLSYRKELDGLRALAVLAVIIYHANLEIGGVQIFKGGFFGVDVFFVLSGYLITGIIRKQKDNSSFSIIDFYWRRAKRIVPALLVMLLITSIVAYFILLPNDLVSYTQTLQSALYFGSNYFFYGEDSYIAESSIYKPLLHTWSLAVEWQFYLVYPIIIWVIKKIFKQYMFSILLALALLSLQYANFIVPKNPDMAFYLLPARAWELILGGLITFYNRDSLLNAVKGTFEYFTYKSLPLIGLFLVIHSMLFWDHNVQHPSFLTLIPIFGTCLFVMFSHRGELTNDLLSIRPIAFLGIISYSLYLWHQPIFVFYRLLKHDYFRPEQFLLLLIISLILSILTCRFIEAPFRKKVLSKMKLALLVILTFSLYFFSYYTQKQDGFPERLGPIANLFNELNDNKLHKINNIRCHNQRFEKSCKVGSFDGENLLILGDSHAGSIAKNVYQMANERSWSYQNLTPSGCLGINTVIRKDKKKGNIIESKRCTEESEKISKYLENDETPRFTIVFVTRLPLYLSGERFDNKTGGIELGDKSWIEPTSKNVTASEEISNKLNLWSSLGHKLILVYPIPEVGWHVPKLVQKELNKHLTLYGKQNAYKNLIISTSYDLYKSRTSKAFETLDKVNGKNIIRVYPDKVFCPNQGKCVANDKKQLYYYDDDHLSTHGAKLLIEEIARLL